MFKVYIMLFLYHVQHLLKTLCQTPQYCIAYSHWEMDKPQRPKRGIDSTIYKYRCIFYTIHNFENSVNQSKKNGTKFSFHKSN